MKKFMVVAMMVTGVMATTLVGCGNVSVSTSNTSTNSETEVIEDQGGTEHEVTHKVVTEDGDTKEYFENVVFDIDNQMDESIQGFYLASSGSDDWGENLLVVGDEAHTLGKGDVAYGYEVDYSTEDSHINVKVVTGDGGEIIFNDFDLMGIDGANQFKFVVTYNADNESYNVSIES